MGSDFSFILKRLINAVFLLLFVSLMTFGIMKLDFTVPKLNLAGIALTQHPIKIQTGDPLAELRLNPAISEEQIKSEEQRLGLDKGFWQQYWTWLGNLLQGELGYTQNNKPVLKVILPALKNTLILNLIAIFCSWALAIPLGIYTGIKHNTGIDIFIRLVMSSIMAIPSFVLAIFMLVLILNTGALPIGGLTSYGFENFTIFEQFIDLARHLAVPVFILTVISIPGIQRQMRANLIDVLDQGYIQTARAKGLKESRVIYKHALRNAINPLITILGYEFAGIFAGSALVEMVLAYPGLGLLTLEAARKLDMNIVMANLLLGSFMLVLGNLLADLLLKKVDPRIS
jgi:peptide/nickel transport system permease protein